MFVDSCFNFRTMVAKSHGKPYKHAHGPDHFQKAQFGSLTGKEILFRIQNIWQKTEPSMFSDPSGPDKKGRHGQSPEGLPVNEEAGL